MSSVGGTGNQAATALYTSVLAAGAFVPALRVTAASVPATQVDLKQNGMLLQRSQLLVVDILVPVFLSPGDVLTYEVNASSGGTWAFDFYLYPQGSIV